VPIMLWIALAIVVFNVAFVAFRVWVTRDRPARLVDRAPAFPPAYATLVAKEYPHRSAHVHRTGRGHH